MEKYTCTCCGTRDAPPGIELGDERRRWTLCPMCATHLLAAILPIFSGAFVAEAVEKLIRTKGR